MKNYAKNDFVGLHSPFGVGSCGLDNSQKHILKRIKNDKAIFSAVF
jgi:hypothetical protein